LDQINGVEVIGVKIHETQGERSHTSDERETIVPEIEQIQRIEGGGPPRKVIMNHLPLPIRIFAYFVISSVVFMAVFGIIMSIVD
jgi:hypothetical protein